MDNIQKRARSGGEFGVNGEFYEGGKFLPSNENRPKTAPAERPEVAQARADRSAEAARIENWLTSRRERFAALIAGLLVNTSEHSDEFWAQMVENHQAGFLPSLGRTLYMTGTLSQRQAEALAKNQFGRMTKKNADEFENLVNALTENYAA